VIVVSDERRSGEAEPSARGEPSVARATSAKLVQTEVRRGATPRLPDVLLLAANTVEAREAAVGEPSTIAHEGMVVDIWALITQRG
jgi:hypothetical protein